MSGTTYRVVLHRDAHREILALPKKVRVQVREVIDGLRDDPRPHGAVPLKGRSSAYRIRVGDHRILYEVHATEIVVYVIGVGHRRDVYVRLLRRR
jgi:mRNA interferase RelE/StbE